MNRRNIHVFALLLMLNSPAAGAMDKPEVTSAAIVAPDIVWLEIQDRRVTLVGQVPYTSMPTDQIEASGKEVIAWDAAGGSQPTIVRTQKSRVVRRLINGKKHRIGSLGGINGDTVWPGPAIQGVALDTNRVTKPDAY